MSALESNFESLVHALVPIGYLSPGNRAQLLRQAEIVRYRRGDHVFKEGDRDPYSIFLLEGRLELRSRGQVVQRLTGGSADAAHALAQLQPRKMSARAEGDAAVLRVNRDLLERLVASDGADGYCAVQVNEIDAEDSGDWMTRILQSKLFAHLPASNIHRIFSLLEETSVRQGEVVVRQGDAGDYYYIIAQGRCEVTRSAGPSAPGYRLALLGPGDTFGEEALVAGSSRNATVRMMSDGELVRLPKEAFVDLIQKPLLSGVTFKEAGNLIGSKNAAWLDVRFPEEYRENGLDGSINHPLNTLRMHSGRLDRLRTYVVYCDTGTRSAVAAFLLAERGFDVHYLEGGLMRYDMLRSGLPASADVDLSLHDDSAPDAEVPHALSGPVPISHQTAAEDAAVTAAALSVELAISDLHIADVTAHAERASAPTARSFAAVDAALEEATARARAEAGQAAAEKIEFERQRIAAEIQAARVAAEQAAEHKLREEKARIDSAAAAARRELAEAQRLKAELEQARRQATQVEHDHALRLKDELERARADAEHARLAAEQAAQLAAAREHAEADRLKAELEQTRAEAERARIAAEQAAQLAVERELAQAERLKAAAEEARLTAERMAASEREQAEAERARAEAERMRAEAAAAARREAAEAQSIRVEIERARAQAEAAVAEAARRELAEAQRLKAEIERAKAEADELVRQERAQQRAREEQVRAEMERRLQEEERKLRESYAWQAEELKRLQTQKSEAEARLRDEQERVGQQAEESRVRLAEAREYQKRLQEVQEASEHEAAMREQQQLALERKLREELRHKAQSERRQLEEELARNAAELDRARREREAAEAARHAAAEEAQQIIIEFKDALARRRMQEEAEMRFERERLEAESRRLRLALELAQREKEAVLENQRRIAAQIAALEDADPTTGNATQSDLNALRAEARAVAAQVEERERARADAQAAAVASAGDLAAHKMHEVQVRSDLKQELDEWLREQEASDASEMQRGILANQRAHLERIKQRAQAVRAAAKAHDQALINELAEKLQRGEVE